MPFLNAHPFNTASANGVSDAIDIRHLNGLSISVTTTGNGTATLTAELCDHPSSITSGNPAKVQPGPGTPVWVTEPTINTLLTKPADGTAGSIRVNVSDVRAGWIRFRLASTSGAYTCDVRVTSKGNG